jgi:hypothetical protein
MDAWVWIPFIMIMLLAGLLALMLFITVTIMLSETPGWPQIPSAEQVRSITDISHLRSRTVDAYEKLGIYVELVDNYRWYFLTFGCFLAIGSVLHFALTPWRLRDKSK